jgi:hypothetical protein
VWWVAVSSNATPSLPRWTRPWALAERGGGSIVLLSGHAGLGKTTVVGAFLRAMSGRARVLAGACHDLVTPRLLDHVAPDHIKEIDSDDHLDYAYPTKDRH